MKRTLCMALSLWVGVAAMPGGSMPDARAQDPKPAKETRAPGGVNPAASAYFTEVELLNQDDKPMRFYTDLLKGKVVVINSFYGDCTDTCPVIMRNLAKVQESLGDRFGTEVFFLSLTVDPVTDTPPRLKAYAGKIGAKPGWFLLTGKKENVEKALYKVGQYVQSKEDHLTLLVIGNDRTGLWKKAFALAPPEAVARILESVLTDGG